MPSENKYLRLSSVNILPWVKWRLEDGEIYGDGLQDHMFALLFHALRKKLNYTLELIIAGENDLGTEISPGNWTSAIGMLVRKEVDLYAGIFFIISDLFPYVEYNTAYQQLEFSVLSGPPSKLHQKNPSLFSSVTFHVWLVLGISWIGVSVVYYILSILESKIRIFNKGEEISLIEYLLTFYGLLFQRGFENLPTTVSRRILATGWLFLVLILTVELSGALSSKLAVEDVPERIDKIQDILKYPILRPYVAKGTGADNFLSAAQQEDLKAVWNQVERKEGLCSYSKLYEESLSNEISEGKAVAIGSVEGHFLVLVNAACKQQVRPFYIAKEAFFSSSFTGMYKRGLDHHIADAINIVYLTYGSLGFSQRLWKELGKYTAPCLQIQRSQITYSTTMLSGMVGVFQTLGFGLLVSFIVFAMELLVPTLMKCIHNMKYIKTSQDSAN